MADPRARQALIDQCVSDRDPISLDDPELAAVLVLVAVNRSQRERAGIEKGLQPVLGFQAELLFVVAARWAELRRINVSYPDLRAAKPKCVAVDDAVDPRAGVARPEGRSLHIRR